MYRFSQFIRGTFRAVALPILVAGIAIGGPGNYNQQGAKLVGVGGNTSQCQAQGGSVALSADGNTALISGACDVAARVVNNGAYVFVRTNGVWSQQGPELEFSGTSSGLLGSRVALSGDGNTAVLSKENVGAIVFTRSGGVWSVESQLTAPGVFRPQVAISSDGNTAAVTSLESPSSVTIFLRSAGVWSALGTVTTDIAFDPVSSSVSISADGTTIAWGMNTNEEDDNCDECAPSFSSEAKLYVITRSGNAITPLLVNDVKIVDDVPVLGSGPSGGPVSLTADGNTLLCNGSFLYRKNGIWTFSTDTVRAIVLSADGNTAIGPGQFSHLALASVRVGGVWSVHQTITYSNDATQSIPTSFALSANGDTAIIGDLRDNNLTGAAWVYASPQFSTALTHSGSFLRGQVGATYNAIIKNVGDREIHAGAASAVNAIDTLPAGLTATKMAGPGWSCTLATLTCTRSDGLAVGASFPAITITVNVANNAPSSVTNLVTATGGGCNWAGSRDVTRILP